MVKGGEDSVFLRLNEKFERLVNELHDPNKTTERNVTYLETTPLLEFEKKYKTEVKIKWSEPSVKEVPDKDNPGQLIEKEIPSHRYASFLYAEQNAVASVNKSIKPEEEKAKERLAISHCLDANGKPFWLIHRLDKVTVPPPAPVDIDELNRELDSLLNIQDG